MDWLEQHSPMIVNWKLKSLVFQYQDTEVLLQELQTDLSVCTAISIHELLQLDKNDDIWCAMEVDISD